MKIEVSNGDIIDKLTIVQIKLESIKDASKLLNLQREYNVLKDASMSIIGADHPLLIALYKVNYEIWNIENLMRDFERNKDFGDDFIDTARLVYSKNDKRAEIKRDINILTSSGLIEEKSYGK